MAFDSFEMDTRAFESSLKAHIAKAKLKAIDEIDDLCRDVVTLAQVYCAKDSGETSITYKVLEEGVYPQGVYRLIGSRSKIALWLEYGTGIYGPEKRRITPKSGKYLHWIAKDGTPIFVRSTAGMPAQPAFRPALMEEVVAWNARHAG